MKSTAKVNESGNFADNIQKNPTLAPVNKDNAAKVPTKSISGSEAKESAKARGGKIPMNKGTENTTSQTL